MWRKISLLLPLLATLFLLSTASHASSHSNVPFQRTDTTWTAPLLAQLSTEEKLGQLLMLRSDLSATGMTDSLLNWVQAQQLGGILLEDLPIDTFLHYVGMSERMTAIPLFNATSHTSSLHHQFSDIAALPHPATIGAITDTSLLTTLATHYEQQLAALRINMVYAPVLSTDFDTKMRVHAAEEAICANFDWLERTQSKRVLAIGSHFIDQEDTYWNWLTHFDSGLSGVGVDVAIHQKKDADCEPTDYLRKRLDVSYGFDGLVVGEVEHQETIGALLQAGADVFIVRDDIHNAYAALKRYYATGVLSEQALNDKVRKILLAKNWANPTVYRQFFPPLIAEAAPIITALPVRQSIDPILSVTCAEEETTHPIKAYFEDRAWEHFSRQLYESSLVLANNARRVLPLRELHGRDFQIFQYGAPVPDFTAQFSKYATAEERFVQTYAECNDLPALSQKYLQYSTVVLTINQEYLDTERCQDWLASANALANTTTVIVVNFGNPRNLSFFSSDVSCIQVMQDHPSLQSLSAQLIFGGVAATGQLTMDISPHLPFGTNHHTPIIRLKYGVPAEVGIAAERLRTIDALARSAIGVGATPGCQVLVAKGGNIIYNRTFGHHTYAKQQPVQSDDLYDLASITKVAATTLATMKLYEQTQLDLSDKLHRLLPLSSRSTLRSLTARQLLTHRSGLQPNLPIVSILRDTTGRDCRTYFCDQADLEYSLPVARDLYFSRLHADTIWQKVQRLRVSRRKRYRYGDTNFYLLQQIVESKSGMGLEQYMNDYFYKALHLRHLTYNPWQRFTPERIIPTTRDNRWRRQLVHAYVHDETAALQGGVGGNAGLFTTAEDLAVLFQMLLNGGHYGGRQFLNPHTIDYFTAYHAGSRRGLGFDKPKKDGRRGACAASASSKTFGHTGFTGTMVWSDPAHELTFILLTNRIHPSRANKRLYEDKIRSRMHQAVYDALDTYQGQLPSLQLEQRS